jgi:predicted DNA-binding transcriptional regulator AlpA
MSKGSLRTTEGVEGRALPDRLLDVHEAAALLGLKPATLYAWAYERRIATVKLSGPRGPVRFRLSTIVQLIEQSEQPALQSPSRPGGGPGRIRDR